MIKFIIGLFLCGSIDAQIQMYQSYGVAGTLPTTITIGATSINAAANWLSLGFQVLSAKTILKVRVYDIRVGTLGANDIKCAIQAETNLAPSGSDLDSTTSLTTPIPASVGWSEFTGFAGVVLTPWIPYRIVIKNLNVANPAANYVTFRYLLSFGPGTTSGPASAVQTSIDSGSTWTQLISNAIPVLRIEFTDGSFQGFPIETVITAPASINANHRIRSTVTSGITFTTAVPWKLSVITAQVAKVGTPTGNLSAVIALDNGSTVTTVTNGTSINSYAPGGVDTTVHNAPFYFSPAITLVAGSKYVVYLIESAQSDAAGNYYVMSHWILSNDASSYTLMPMQGTWTGFYCPATPGTTSNWVIDKVNVPAISLSLTPVGEASTSGSGGTRSYSH